MSVRAAPGPLLPEAPKSSPKATSVKDKDEDSETPRPKVKALPKVSMGKGKGRGKGRGRKGTKGGESASSAKHGSKDSSEGHDKAKKSSHPPEDGDPPEDREGSAEIEEVDAIEPAFDERSETEKLPEKAKTPMKKPAAKSLVKDDETVQTPKPPKSTLKRPAAAVEAAAPGRASKSKKGETTRETHVTAAGWKAGPCQLVLLPVKY